MDYLVDTNVLVHAADRTDPKYGLAWDALRSLVRNGHRLVVFPQVMVEFWGVCTRPRGKDNGLGMPPKEAARFVERIEKLLTVLLDAPEIHSAWKDLVILNEVVGKQVHDARLVACMKTHNIQRILTFNARNFRRYAFIEILEPRDIRDGGA